MKNLKMITTALLAIIFLITGCGGIGRKADPTIPYRPTDTNLSCQQIESEMAMSRERYAQFKERKDLKTAQNVGAAIGTILFIVPAFFADLSNVDDTNITSEQNRYKVLTDMASAQQCKFSIPPISVPVVKDSKVSEQ